MGVRRYGWKVASGTSLEAIGGALLAGGKPKLSRAGGSAPLHADVRHIAILPSRSTRPKLALVFLDGLSPPFSKRRAQRLGDACPEAVH
jgi:hypothetical protein